MSNPIWSETAYNYFVGTNLSPGQKIISYFDFSTVREFILQVSVADIAPFNKYYIAIFDVFYQNKCSIPFFELENITDFSAGFFSILLPSGRYAVEVTNLDPSNNQIVSGGNRNVSI